jgi:hypothetical protein
VGNLAECGSLEGWGQVHCVLGCWAIEPLKNCTKRHLITYPMTGCRAPAHTRRRRHACQWPCEVLPSPSPRTCIQNGHLYSFMYLFTERMQTAFMMEASWQSSSRQTDICSDKKASGRFGSERRGVHVYGVCVCASPIRMLRLSVCVSVLRLNVTGQATATTTWPRHASPTTERPSEQGHGRNKGGGRGEVRTKVDMRCEIDAR